MVAGFQQQVYTGIAQAVAGDFASQNPYASFDAGPGGLVAGAACYVGRFAWAYPPVDPNGGPTVLNCVGNGPVAGFIHREMQASIIDYLATSSMKILPGQQVTAHIAGDYWVVNDGAAYCVPGMKAFAINGSGLVRFAAAGTIVGGASATGSTVADATAATMTGSIAGDVVTVTAVLGGTVYPGSTVSGTGVQGTPKVVSQISGTPGGIGTYRIDTLQSAPVAATTLSFDYGILTIGTATGTFEVGDILTGTGVVAGTRITANISGTGGTGGTMVVDNNTVVASATITASDAVETKWFARSSGAQGELVKISSYALG